MADEPNNITLTQEDYNDKIKSEVSKGKNDLLKRFGVSSVDEFIKEREEFNTFKQSQLTSTEKMQERLNAFEVEQKEWEKEKWTMNTSLVARDLNIKNDFTNDVITLAKSRVNDNTDIKAAMEEVTKLYPNFLNSQEEQQENHNFGKPSENTDNNPKLKSENMKAFEKLRRR